MENQDVKAYYNKISSNYDESRFNNTYGKFIDDQERSYLNKNLISRGIPINKKVKSLNLGCGTGRFMEYTTDGLDFSSEMMEVAKSKYPDKLFHLSDASNTPFENDSFDEVICFHVFMHLSKENTEEIFKEVHRILKPGGQFIFDYPSSDRRKITRYKAESWHGANDYSLKEMKDVWVKDWKNKKSKGVLFLPIHRIPKKIRKVFYGLDQILSMSPLKHYSSYIIQSIKKK